MSAGLNNLYHTIQPLCWRQAPVCLWVASPPIRHVCESSTRANGVGWGIGLSAGSEASFFYLPAVHVSNPKEQPLYALPSVPRSSVSLDLSSHDATKKRDGMSVPVGCGWQRYMFDQGAWGWLIWWCSHMDWVCLAWLAYSQWRASKVPSAYLGMFSKANIHDCHGSIWKLKRIKFIFLLKSAYCLFARKKQENVRFVKYSRLLALWSWYWSALLTFRVNAFSLSDYLNNCTMLEREVADYLLNQT